MTGKKIFEYLLKITKKSKDPEGAVGACLVKNEKIILSSISADDGIRHAEDLLIEKAIKEKFDIDKNVILYTTLEPCSYRTPGNHVKDCTTIIIKSGIKNVIFAAKDLKHSKTTKKRFKIKGIKCKQVKDKNIIEKALNLFNATVQPFKTLL